MNNRKEDLLLFNINLLN